METENRWTLIASALIAAVLGVLATQVLHEFCYGLAAMLVGAQWQAFNLFAVQWAWPGAATTAGGLLIEANPAVVNMVTGLAAAFWFNRSRVGRSPMLNLFLLYFAGYSIFMGFGYLLVDPLFYQPGGEHLGDWKKVIDMLGGTWTVRLPIFLIGTAGVLWGFFWLARSVWRFADDATDPVERKRVALPLLLLPYLILNIFFTILALWHPMGADGVFIVLFQYWFGYIGFFWAFFLSAFWLEVKMPVTHPLTVPQSISLPWSIAAGVAGVITVGVLLPTIWF